MGFGFIGNITTIFFISFRESFHNATYTVIALLAFVDLLALCPRGLLVLTYSSINNRPARSVHSCFVSWNFHHLCMFMLSRCRLVQTSVQNAGFPDGRNEYHTEKFNFSKCRIVYWEWDLRSYIWIPCVFKHGSTLLQHHRNHHQFLLCLQCIYACSNHCLSCF